MKRISAFAFCVCLAWPAQAEDAEDGSTLLERGAQMFLEGLLQEMGPALDGMQDLALRAGPAFSAFIEAMGPGLADILDKVEDWSVYEPPEILENGDIIIRRKPEEPPEASGDNIEI